MSENALLEGDLAASILDAYLNVQGSANVFAAVLRCWASLWSARAITYRTRMGIE